MLIPFTYLAIDRSFKRLRKTPLTLTSTKLTQLTMHGKVS